MIIINVILKKSFFIKEKLLLSIIMLKNISKIVNTKDCYNFLSKTIPILYEEYDDTFLHNDRRLELHKKSRYTFEGYMSCGGTTYMLHYYLKKFNIDTNLGLKSFGYGKYLEDHCFLYKDDLIIDPTYRQIFRINANGNSYYQYYLYNLPFIFVGNIDDLIFLNNDLIKNYYVEFNKTFDDDKLYFWKDYSDNSSKLDCHLVANDINYAINKGEIYYNLHNILNKN
jgi:hypothetical protein